MYKKYAQDICVLGSNSLMLKGLSVTLLALLTKGLGAGTYGIWAQIYVTVLLLGSISRLGLNIAASRFLPAQKNIANISKDFSSILSLIFMSGLLFSLVLIAFSDVLAIKLFRNPQAAYFIKLAAFLILFFGCTEVVFRYFRIYRKIQLFSLLTVSRSLIEVALVALVLYCGFGLTGSIISMLLSWAIIFIIGIVLIFSKIKFSFPDFNAIKRYFVFGLPLLVTPVIAWIIFSSDRYIIAYFLDSKSVGIYSAAYRLGSLAFLSIVAVDSLLFIATSKLYDERKYEEVKKHFCYSLKFFLTLTIPSTIGISLLATPLLRMFTTQEFLYGAKVLPFIAFAVIGFGLFRIFILIPFLAKKSKINLLLLSITAILNLSLNIILVPHFGIMGAAFATLFAYVVLGLGAIIASLRYLRFNVDVNFIVKAVFASGAMGLIITILRQRYTMSILLIIPLAAFVYFAALLLLKGFSEQEIKFARNLIGNN